MILEETLEKIKKPSQEAMERCRQHWDSIAKPLHSLGKLEDALVRIAGMTGNERIHLDKKALVVMCADNGVVEEGVTQSGQEVTAIVSENMLSGKATSSIMCRSTGADIFPVDIGIARDTSLRNEKVAYGTKNMAKGPAMTRREAVQAIETGIRIVRELKEKGYQILATGEMGIGNTTTSSAMAAALLKCEVPLVTGKGAGLSEKGLLHKQEVIGEAIRKYDLYEKDAFTILETVGGLDIAGLVGVCIGGAIYRIPIVLDGVISLVAALTAEKIAPGTKKYLLTSHQGKEPAAKFLLKALEKEAVLNAHMALGEGTGAVMMFPLLDMALRVYHAETTFFDIQVEQYQELK